MRRDARRVDILRAAAQTFRRVGFAAAGMRDIADAAALSPANLYHYFRGKDELLYFCQTRTLDRLLAALERARRTRGPLAGRLHDLAVAHVLCLIDEVDASAAHLETSALPPRLRVAVVAKRDRYERGVRALVGDAIKTRAFLGALNWTAQWYRPDGAEAAAAVAEQVATFAVAGLTLHDTRPRRPHRQRRTDRGRVRPVQNPARGAA
jgi:AcrR family transcriptional regulator